MLPVLRGLLRLTWFDQMTLAAAEVPWHQKRVDLVLMRDEDVFAVELKVSKWKKAIDQAAVNRWASDSSWVALWHDCITADALAYAREAGVGILAVTANTAYPLTHPHRPTRTAAAPRLAAEVTARGSRVRDLLGDSLRTGLALA